MKVYILNTGGTLGMVPSPDPEAGGALVAAKTAAELMQDIVIPQVITDKKLEDFPRIQDSTNITHDDRIEMAQLIAEAYEDYDAFVVLHGTDSLAETAAVLSMVFKLSLQKPLFVIGAQMTKDEAGSDVSMQVSNTLRIADAFHRKGIVGVYNVCIDDVWDGSRLRKRAESDKMAFHTPGRQPVAKCWPTIHFNQGLRRKDGVTAVQGLRLDTLFDRRVATIKVSADTPPYLLIDQINNKRLSGVILEAKGAGNIPDRIWDNEFQYSWIDAIRMATEEGIHVAILSPFEDGRVILDRYDLGKKAKKAGALSLESLTPDMADAKFRQAIAMHRGKPDRIQEFLSTDIVGELLPGEEVLI